MDNNTQWTIAKGHRLTQFFLGKMSGSHEVSHLHPSLMVATERRITKPAALQKDYPLLRVLAPSEIVAGFGTIVAFHCVAVQHVPLQVGLMDAGRRS